MRFLFGCLALCDYFDIEFNGNARNVRICLFRKYRFCDSSNCHWCNSKIGRLERAGISSFKMILLKNSHHFD